MSRGHTNIAEQYQLDKLLPLSQKITQINTTLDAPNDFPEIGFNAYRTMLSFFDQKGDFKQELTRLNGEHVQFNVTRKMDVPVAEVGGENGYRITPVASNEEVIFGRMKELGVFDCDVTYSETRSKSSNTCESS